jgi:glucosyl-dolichyl phosphate glucuronosyltransferase
LLANVRRVIVKLEISAVICTHNRVSFLSGAITSLMRQTLNQQQYEILIIDNASTDSTRKLLLEQFRDVPNLRYLHESHLGLSRARNTGWRNARGQHVAYLDDDAIANQDWLSNMLRAFRAAQPFPGAIGGKVVPIWEERIPSWFTGAMMSALPLLDLSPAPTRLKEKQWLVGTNVSYPRRVLERMGGFNVNLGRKGRLLLGHEEGFLHGQLIKDGYALYYDPSLVVHHHIQAERLTQPWQVRRYYWDGVSMGQFTRDAARKFGFQKWRHLLLELFQVVLHPLRLVYYWFKFGKHAWFQWKYTLAYHVGFIQTLLRPRP